MTGPASYLLARCQIVSASDGGKRAMTWEPIWALPNIDLDKPVESCIFALVPASDPRVDLLKWEHGSFQTFMSRFQDTHGDHISPTLIIRPNSMLQNPLGSWMQPLAFAIFLLPLAVAASEITNHESTVVIFIESTDSSFFWVYPWMTRSTLRKNNRTHTGFTLALHDVDQFRGQSSPELSRTTLLRRDFDEPLLNRSFSVAERCTI